MVKAASHAVDARKKARVPKVIRFGSDCSGMDTAAYALKRLGVHFVHKFASDTHPAARKIIELSSRPERLFDDMLSRTTDEEPEVDIYVTTPPCQDVSAAGTETGRKGKTPRRVGVGYAP